jgi:hypothetical protein
MNMAQKTSGGTFSDSLSTALLMAIPGMMKGIGQGIYASDPRQPYKGLGAGLSAGAESMSGLASAVAGQRLKEQSYERGTEQMIERQKALTRAGREMEQEEAEYNAQQFKSMRSRGVQEHMDRVKKEAGMDIGKLGDFNFSDKMFLARLGAAGAMRRMSAVEASRSAMGGMA